MDKRPGILITLKMMSYFNLKIRNKYKIDKVLLWDEALFCSNQISEQDINSLIKKTNATYYHWTRVLGLLRYLYYYNDRSKVNIITIGQAIPDSPYIIFPKIDVIILFPWEATYLLFDKYRNAINSGTLKI